MAVDKKRKQRTDEKPINEELIDERQQSQDGEAKQQTERFHFSRV